jgi:hypothetical protein
MYKGARNSFLIKMFHLSYVRAQPHSGCGTPAHASQFPALLEAYRSRNSVVGIATGCGLDGVRVPVGSRILDHTGSGVHSTSYPMGTVDHFPGGKAAGA